MKLISTTFAFVLACSACADADRLNAAEVHARTLTAPRPHASGDGAPRDSAEGSPLAAFGPEATGFEPRLGDRPDRGGSIPIGLSPEDVAARVALTAFAESDWLLIVAEDLSPAFAAAVESERTGAALARPEPPTLVVVSVDRLPGAQDDERYVVSFDEIADGGALIRHVTAVDVHISGDRAVVTALVPLA